MHLTRKLKVEGGGMQNPFLTFLNFLAHLYQISPSNENKSLNFERDQGQIKNEGEANAF